MEYLPNDLSRRIDDDVVGLYRHFGSSQTTMLWLEKQRQYLVRTQLDQGNCSEWEDWLMRLYATMRLQYLMEAEGKEAALHPQHYLRLSQGPEADVIDLLAKGTPLGRLCEIGGGTYEMFLCRLQAMAMLGVTFDTSSDEYITRYCTAFSKFNEPVPDVTSSEKMLPILLSARKALNSTTFSGNVMPIPERRVKSPAQKRNGSILVALCAFAGLITLCAAMWLFRIGKEQTNSTSQGINAQRPASSNYHPTSLSKAEKSPPVADAVDEKAGYYVIGLAAREEARAWQESELRKREGIPTQVVYSSRWSGLTPGYFLVVYGVVNSRAETKPLRKALEKRGIKTYVMHSGKRLEP